MPPDVVGGGWRLAGLGRAEGGAGEAVKPFVDSLGAADVLGDEDAEVVVEADGAAVERLVVERAQGGGGVQSSETIECTTA